MESDKSLNVDGKKALYQSNMEPKQNEPISERAFRHWNTLDTPRLFGILVEYVLSSGPWPTSSSISIKRSFHGKAEFPNKMISPLAST
jgi:hypothetical protein